jgi:aminopeptidase N
MKTVSRLYTNFHPETYDLLWRIDEQGMRFSGSVTIHGKRVGRPSNRLTFHQKGLKITSATIKLHDKKVSREIEVSRLHHHDTLHEIRLHTNDQLYAGNYVVTMEFEADITNGMTGIYPCYFEDDSVAKKLFATQFESHHAREAFPCIDEPEAKAVFNLTLDTAANILVLGNTPVKAQSTERGRLVSSFEPTPRMSTYLLAFVCGDLHSKETHTDSGVLVRAWATTAQPLGSLDFALDAAKRSIEYFEDYFGVPYPLAKADHVALPDFSSGAMENWGLITYRERVMLAYPDETAQSTRETIALVVAHETSHQWFGNLVTMKWWDDLWLNESFANMMEYAAVDSMYPEWHVWDGFVAAEGLSALRRDAIPGVQSVQVAVHHPDEISTLFDPSIVYAKGGRLLNMLKNYIGEQAFREGLRNYFTQHAYGNTTGRDLWEQLSASSGKDISAFMTPWLARAGYPVVHVDIQDKHLVLSQEQFLDNPAKADADRIWPVPLFARSSVSSTVPEVLSAASTRVTFPRDGDLLIDPDSHGHYIVDYRDETLRQTVLEKVADKSLSEAGRLMLLIGNSMLARSGYKPYAEVLSMLEKYSEETSEPVWDSMALIAGEVRRFIDAEPQLEPRIRAFSAKLAALQLKRLGWDTHEQESSADTKLRGLILGLSVYGEVETVLAEALSRFTTYKAGGTVPAELRSLIMTVPVLQGDDAAFEFLLAQHDATSQSELKADICDALTSTRSPKRASELLARLTDAKLVKPQDVDRWLLYLLRNRYTRETAWTWMVENWSWLEETFKADKSYDYLPRYAASCVNTPEYETKYHALFESKLDQTALKRNIELGFEEISARLTWLARDREGISKFFADK